MEPLLLSLHTPGEVGKLLAERMRSLRLSQDWTRESLARRAGVSSASLKRFETTGAGSLDLVLRLAFALGRLEPFARLLEPEEAVTLAELEARSVRPVRRRGRR